MNIGEKIKFYRKNLKLTQEELAKRSRLSRNAIYNYEKGKRQPDFPTLDDIAEALGCTLYDLISTTDKPIDSISTGSIGTRLAKVANKTSKEMNLIYEFLASRYGEENININPSIDEQFIELYIGDNTIVYTKHEFEKFIDHISKLFPAFKIILDSETK